MVRVVLLSRELGCPDSRSFSSPAYPTHRRLMRRSIAEHQADPSRNYAVYPRIEGVVWTCLSACQVELGSNILIVDFFNLLCSSKVRCILDWIVFKYSLDTTRLSRSIG